MSWLKTRVKHCVSLATSLPRRRCFKEKCSSDWVFTRKVISSFSCSLKLQSSAEICNQYKSILATIPVGESYLPSQKVKSDKPSYWMTGIVWKLLTFKVAPHTQVSTSYPFSRPNRLSPSLREQVFQVKKNSWGTNGAPQIRTTC